MTPRGRAWPRPHRTRSGLGSLGAVLRPTSMARLRHASGEGPRHVSCSCTAGAAPTRTSPGSSAAWPRPGSPRSPSTSRLRGDAATGGRRGRTGLRATPRTPRRVSRRRRRAASSSSGHSFGGRVAVCLAATSPDAVGCAGPHRRPARPLGDAGVAALAPLPGDPARRQARRWCPDARLEAARRRYGSSDYRAATGIVRDVLVATVARELRGRARRAAVCPIALVWGSRGHDRAARRRARRAGAGAARDPRGARRRRAPRAHRGARAARRGDRVRAPRCALNPARDRRGRRGARRRHASCAWLRWLRVAQREHYLPGAVSALRGALVDARRAARLALGARRGRRRGAWRSRRGLLAAVDGRGRSPSGRSGSSVRGRTSPLAWTRRLRTLAVTLGGAPRRARRRRGVHARAVRRGRGHRRGGDLVVDAAGCCVLAPVEDAARRPWVRARSGDGSPQVDAGASWRSPAATARPRPSTTSPSCWRGSTTVVPTPAQLQQPRRPRDRGQRPPRRRHGGVHRRDGHLRRRARSAAMCAWCRPTSRCSPRSARCTSSASARSSASSRRRPRSPSAPESSCCNVDDERLGRLARSLRDGRKGRAHRGLGDAPTPTSQVAVAAERWRVVIGGRERRSSRARSPACSRRTSRARSRPRSRSAPSPSALAARIGHVAPVANRLTVASRAIGCPRRRRHLQREPRGRGRRARAPRQPARGRAPRRRDAGHDRARARGSAPRTRRSPAPPRAIAAAVVVVGRTNVAALRRGATRGRARTSSVWRRASAPSSGCAARSAG